MSVDVEIPQPFEVGFGVSGAVDLDLDNVRLSVDALPAVNVAATTTNQVNSDSQVTLNSNSELTANINTSSSVDLNSSNQLDLNGDLSGALKGELNGDIKAEVKSDSQVNTDSKVVLNSDSKVDAGLDNLRIKELPEIAFRAGLLPTCIRFPLSFKWRFKVFGVEVFKVEVSGEPKVVIEK